MAVFDDALDLRTAVVELVKDPSIVDVWTRTLSMAEVRINRIARHRRQITATTLAFVDGEADLPADFLEVLHLYGTGNAEMFEVPLSITKDTGSMWRYFSIDGEKAYIYGFSGDRTMEYFATIPTITTSLASTSWVLTGYPDVYLYTTAAEAAAHLQDTERAAAFAQLADRALTDMHRESNRARFGRGVVIPRGANP